MKLNWDKCDTMDIGRGIGDDGCFGTTIMQEKAVRYLGIWFSVYGTILKEDWWKGMVEKWEAVLKGWAGRNLSLMGRVIVLNIYWLPKLWYLGYHLDFPRWVVNRLMKAMSGWLWKGKRPQVGWDVLTLRTKDGGLGLTDPHRRLRALQGWWGRRMVELDKSEWGELARDNWHI